MRRALERERFVVLQKFLVSTIYMTIETVQNWQMINHALAELEEANREKLGGHDGSNIFLKI